MQNFENESFRRSRSSAKNIHNLRPSVLSRSSSQSSVSQTKKMTNFANSNSEPISKLFSSKVNFTYNQQPAKNLSRINQTNSLSQFKQDNLEQKKERKTFLNVISKESVPQQIIKFVYGSNTSNFLKCIDLPSIQLTSIKPFLGSNLEQIRGSQSQIRVKRQNSEIKCSEINEQMIESFPNSKIKKAKNSSVVKTTQTKFQLLHNCKNQAIEIQPFDLKQQIYEEANIQISHFKQISQKAIINQLQNQKETTNTVINTTGRQKQENQFNEYDSQKLLWNDTIKINSLFPQNEGLDEKHKQTNVLSTANQSFNPFSTVQADEKRHFKNQTQKISQFLLCDQQINQVLCQANRNPQYSKEEGQESLDQAHNLDTINIEKSRTDSKKQDKLETYDIKDKQAVPQVPVFQLNLRDPSLFSSDKDQIQVDLQNNKISQQHASSHSSMKKEPLLQCDKLGQNLEVLGLNIQDLAKTIQSFPYQRNYLNENQKASRNFKDNLKGENFEKGGENQRTREFSISQQKTIEISIKGQKKENQSTNEFIPCQQSEKSSSKQKNKDTLGHDSKTQKTNEQELKESQNYLNQKSHSKGISIVDTINSSQQQNSSHRNDIHEKSSPNNAMMSSLQIIESHNQIGTLSNSIQQFYSIPEDSLQLSPESSKNLEQNQKVSAKGHFQHPVKFKYPQSLFPQLHRSFHLNTIQDKQSSISFQTNQNVSPKRQNSQKTSQFQKTYQKKQSLNQKYKKSNNSVLESPQRKTKNLFNYLSPVQRSQPLNLSKQKSPQDQKISQKNQLNYELYKIYRSKSVSKHYTKIAIDQCKSKVIQLPLMQNPVQIDGSKIIYPKYIKNKVYYVKG